MISTDSTVQFGPNLATGKVARIQETGNWNSRKEMDVDAVTLVIIVFVVALTTFVFSVLGKYCGEKYLNPKTRRHQRSKSSRRLCYQCSCGGRAEFPSRRFPRRSNDGVTFNVHRNCAAEAGQQGPNEEIRLNTMGRPVASSAAAGLAAPAMGNESSQTFFRLGIRKEEGRDIIDLEGQLHRDDTSPLAKTKNSNQNHQNRSSDFQLSKTNLACTI